MKAKTLTTCSDELDIYVGPSYTTFIVTGEWKSGRKYKDEVLVSPKEAVRLAREILKQHGEV